MNLKLRRAHQFREARTIVAAMMDDIRQRGCDRVVFSGDATTMGFESEYTVAAQEIRFDLPGIAVPGNHDYYVRRAADAGLFERYFAPWQQGERIGTAVYPFAQRVGHCWLIGVNSSRSNFLFWDARGGVDDGEAERLQELLKTLSPGPRILVTHYPLFLAGGEPEHYWRWMRGWQAFQRIVAEGGVSLWLHGHRHTGYVLQPKPPEQPFAIVCAGSATQLDRWSFNEYRIDGLELRMNRRTWSPEANCFQSSGMEETVIHLQQAPGK